MDHHVHDFTQYRNSFSSEFKDLATYSPLRWVWWALVDWAIILIVIVMALSLNVWWMYVAAVWIIGNRQHALILLSHDGIHGNVHPNLKWNDLLTKVFCLWPLGANLESYRVSHLLHHKHLGTLDDPELVLKRNVSPDFDLPASRARITSMYILDCIGINAIREFIPPFTKKILQIIRVIPNTEVQGNKDSALETSFFKRHHEQIIFLGIVMSILMYFKLGVVILMWFTAIMTSLFAVFRLQIWTEHSGTQGTHRFHAPLWQRLFFLSHNQWYHYEHHACSIVPFWNLPRVRALIVTEPVISSADLFDYMASSEKIPSGDLPSLQTTNR